MASPRHVQTEVVNSDDAYGVESIIRTFMLEQERIQSTTHGRRNSVVDQIFRGQGQQLQDQSPPNSDVGRQLAEISSQLDEHYYRVETEQNVATLERFPARRMESLRRIIQGVFQHGITAGHVMSLLIFGHRYILQIIDKGIENGVEICREIISLIISYIKDYVVSWIKSIGGWNGFLDEVKQFVVEQLSLQWNNNRQQLFLGLIVVLTAVNVGAIVWHYKS